MDARKLSKRTQQALADLPPEKRARAETALTRIQSPEYQERERKDRDVLDHECLTTGTIASTPVSEADEEAFQRFILSLRQARETTGLSLDEVALRSGIDKAQLSRLENGKVHDPRPSTLSRYALAIGKRLAWSLEDFEPRQPR
jgi:ribosome-binding protein aMBF1 (putative translation factor)